MTHCVKALAVKCDDLSLVLETHMMEEENQLLQNVFFWWGGVYMCARACISCAHKKKQIYIYIFLIFKIVPSTG